MESKWLKDSLFTGFTANALSLGTVLSLGWFWQRINGCHTVYRGQDGNIDYENIQAVMEPADSDVTVVNQALAPETIWHYVRRGVSDCGIESLDGPVAVIGIDSDGDMIPLTPNSPLSMQIDKVSGGKLKVRWRYSEIGEQITPTGFRIYIDSGSGFDFESPDGTVAYNLGGSGEYEWTSDALIDGQQYRFCVRSYATDAGESLNTDYVAAIADSGGPLAVTGLLASWEAY